jgi:hypothetical protein
MSDFMECKHCRVSADDDDSVLDMTLIGDVVEIGLTDETAHLGCIALGKAGALAMADWIIDHIRGDKS